MANISDIIEAFLVDNLGEDDSLNISRNELASYFSVAPSQINYVLSTRFTPSKGYVIESHRGGGGFITVIKLNERPESILSEILTHPISQGYTQAVASNIIDRLVEERVFTISEARLLKSAISDKALITPTVMQKNALRASILKSVASEAMKKINLGKNI